MTPEALNYSLGGAVLVLIGWTIFQQISIAKIKRNQQKLFQGKEAKNLEEIISTNQEKITFLESEVKNLHKLHQKVYYLAQKGTHKVGVIRFNPFRDIGGDQSFSVALVDHENSGVVISSLYSRDGVRVYAKALKEGKSEKYPLTEEEKQAIKTASIEKDGGESRKIV